MNTPGLLCVAGALSLALVACQAPNTTEPSNTASDTLPNPLLAPYTGPFNGVPAFDEMQLKDLAPALEQALNQYRQEIASIANNPAPATFDNTIAALERSGQGLNRLYTYWGIWRSNMSSDEFREIEQPLSPKLSSFYSEITANTPLFQRVKAVFDSEALNNLTAEQQRVTLKTYLNFTRNGATLSAEGKQRYADIQQQLATLHNQFSNNVLADEENYVLYLTKAQLGGLPQSLVSAFAQAAKSRDRNGEYAVTNTRSSMDPFLTYSTERALREQVWRTYYNRGNNGDEYDNNQVIKQILSLRHERVALMGYDNYAQWRLEDRMAKHPDQAMQLLNKVWPAAIARVKEEVADMQAIANQEGSDLSIEPWDYRFYAEKVRQAKYSLDSEEVKQYLQLDKLRDAMFYVAGRLFNYEFTPVAAGAVPVFHPDVGVWEVTDKRTKQHIGLWYLDPFSRPGKRSGAWATTYRDQSKLLGHSSVLSSNNSNFVKGAAGQPTLISWDDAETYFHEFGHALHFLASDVVYPSSQYGVRDYTEFQSQLLERWLTTDEVINQFLVHYQTGEPMPPKLVDKIKRAATFNEGFRTTEYLASAFMDLKYHTSDPAQIEPQKFEQTQLAQLNMPKQIVMRHRSTHFGHVFSGEGYSSGYYGYLWAEVLTSDAAEAFAKAPGGFYDAALSQKLVKYLFAPRDAIDPAEAYRLFRGKDANVSPLMRDRGFPIQ